jgi:hypothetical protein
MAIGGFAFIGLLVLILGLPRASEKPHPWKWGLGIVVISVSFIGWPLIYAQLAGAELEMVWILVWFATFWTFAYGVQLLIEGAKEEREPLRFQWTRTRKNDTDDLTAHLQWGDPPERNAQHWTAHFQWGNNPAGGVGGKEPNEEEEEAQTLPQDENDGAMNSQPQDDSAAVRPCAWCSNAISMEVDPLALGVKLKTPMNPENARGRAISFSLPVINRPVLAIVPELDSQPARQGNQLIFMVCARDVHAR